MSWLLRSGYESRLLVLHNNARSPSASWLLRSGYESRHSSQTTFLCVIIRRGCCAAATNRDQNASYLLFSSVVSWLLRSGYESRPLPVQTAQFLFAVVAAAQRLRIETLILCQILCIPCRGCCAAATNRDKYSHVRSQSVIVVAAAQRLRIETCELLLLALSHTSWLLRSGYESRPHCFFFILLSNRRGCCAAATNRDLLLPQRLAG